MADKVPSKWDELWEGPMDPLRYMTSVARKASAGALPPLKCWTVYRHDVHVRTHDQKPILTESAWGPGAMH